MSSIKLYDIFILIFYSFNEKETRAAYEKQESSENEHMHRRGDHEKPISDS